MTPKLEVTQHEADHRLSGIEAKLHDVELDMNARLTQMKLEIISLCSRSQTERPERFFYEKEIIHRSNSSCI